MQNGSKKDGYEKSWIIVPLNIYKNPKIMKQTFKINGMSCGSCKQTVEKTLQAVNGVTSAQVS
jgi:hypothetical protein